MLLKSCLPSAHFQHLGNSYVNDSHIFGKVQRLHLTKSPQTNIAYNALKCSTNIKFTATTATKDVKVTDRNIGCFYIENKKGADAYVGIKRLTGRLKEIVCPIVQQALDLGVPNPVSLLQQASRLGARAAITLVRDSP